MTNGKIKHSRFLSLTWFDTAKGAVVGAISGAIAALDQMVRLNQDIFSAASGHAIGLAAIGGTTAYLIKNFFSDTKTVKED